jgi:hypothetical protein
MMILAHVEKSSAVPWWAAFGAPLVGVPLLVALLSLGAPKNAQSNVMDVNKASSTTTEQVEATVSTPVQLPPEYKESASLPRC